MVIRKMRSYFLYNVPVTEHVMSMDEEHRIGVTQALVDRVAEKFTVARAPVPAFYTTHYREEHTPYYVSDETISHQTYIDAGHLKEIDFFSMLDLTQNLRVSWNFMLALQTTGLVTICVEVNEPVRSDQSYRLSGLHLNPDFAVIATEPLKALWTHQPEARRDYVTMDELACAIHDYFFRACNLHVRRFRALRHEIQIPFTAVEVETDCATQDEFIEKNAGALAELVFKPANWEVERASNRHARRVLSENRVWSVAQDTYAVVAYEGALYVKIKTFDTGIPSENAGFFLADEASVLHSFKVAVSNYHLLRILDSLLDREVAVLKRQVSKYQRLLRSSFDEQGISGDNAVLREMNEFVIQVTNLEFDLIELMEELDNSDKLIDEEWHIVLLDKLNDALGVKVWRDSMNARVNNLRELVQTVENTYQRLVNLNVNKNLLEMNLKEQRANEVEKRIGYIFGLFAIAELLGLLINVGLDDNDPLTRVISSSFGTPASISHLLSSISIILLIIVLFYYIRWFVNRDKTLVEEKDLRDLVQEELRD